ncbi:Glutathione S-transferase 1 [Papilio machaon]|uniref:Glutathione S-transferase 1 n=1 Tax=Papilio machaon TaxID=76193 RepID=A0A194R511_PAPMA|nr:Glutathione S-transferase 1 [Papilio machaon]
MVLTLYKLDASPPVRSVLMVIDAAKITEVQYVNVNVLKGEHLTDEYLKMNPQHTIPMLKDGDFTVWDRFVTTTDMNPQHTIPMLKDGDFTVWDSHAISVYLLTKYTDDDALYPIEHKKRALIDQRLHFDSGVLFVALRAAVDPVVYQGENFYKNSALLKIKTAYDFTDKFLTSKWLVGDEITLADICCVANISSLNEILPIDAELYPNLAQWLENCKEQEFYKKGNKPGLEEFRIKIMVLKLYKIDASPPARAAMMTVEAANIPNVELVDIDFFGKEHLKDEYLQKNPQHTVPTLQDDDFYIWDSHAIAVYLLTKYSKNTTLYPSDPKQRAIIDQRLHFDSGILFPSLRGAIGPVIYQGEKAIKPEAFEKIKSGYDFSEKFLTKRWVAGDELTLADIFFMASISSLNEILPIDAATFPKLTAWLNRCKELDYYKKMNESGTVQLGALVKSKLA